MRAVQLTAIQQLTHITLLHKPVDPQRLRLVLADALADPLANPLADALADALTIPLQTMPVR